MNCPNCDKITPIRPPYYRCIFCNYPLNKKKNEISLNIKGDNIELPEEDLDIKTIVDSPSFGNDSGGGININLGDDFPHVEEEKVNDNLKEEPEKKPPEDATKIIGQLSDNDSIRRKDEIVAGWLIVHTEEKEPTSYELYLGDNFFGTEAEGYSVEIPIKDDKYVSRSHANIKVSKDFLHRFRYELFDNGTRRPQGPSTNGTYINGNEERLPKDGLVFLQDGDTIQVGETKLVFKTVNDVNDVEEAATSVINTDYTATVILPK